MNENNELENVKEEYKKSLLTNDSLKSENEKLIKENAWLKEKVKRMWIIVITTFLAATFLLVMAATLGNNNDEPRYIPLENLKIAEQTEVDYERIENIVFSNNVDYERIEEIVEKENMVSQGKQEETEFITEDEREKIQTKAGEVAGQIKDGFKGLAGGLDEKLNGQ